MKWNLRNVRKRPVFAQLVTYYNDTEKILFGKEINF